MILPFLVLALASGRPASAASGTIMGRVEIPEPLLDLLQNQGYASLYRKASGTQAPGSPALEEAVVYLEKVPGEFPPPSRRLLIHHRAQYFLPRVLAILKGASVAFVNDDTYDHVLQSRSVLNPPFKQRLKAGASPHPVRLLKSEEIVVSCDQHLKSRCFVLVMQNPFFTHAGKDGSFTLKNIPPGAYVLKAWHPGLIPAALPVKVSAGKETNTTLTFEKVRYVP